jgi:hypothetical protein
MACFETVSIFFAIVVQQIFRCVLILQKSHRIHSQNEWYEVVRDKISCGSQTDFGTSFAPLRWSRMARAEATETVGLACYHGITHLHQFSQARAIPPWFYGRRKPNTRFHQFYVYTFRSGFQSNRLAQSSAFSTTRANAWRIFVSFSRRPALQVIILQIAFPSSLY